MSELNTYIFVSSEVICQVYAEILSTVNHCQRVSMELVDGWPFRASVEVYSDDLTLSILGMKLYLPL